MSKAQVDEIELKETGPWHGRRGNQFTTEKCQLQEKVGERLQPESYNFGES